MIYKNHCELLFLKIYKDVFISLFNNSKKTRNFSVFSFFIFFFLKNSNFMNFFKFNKNNKKDAISTRFYLVKLKKRIKYFT